MKFSACRIEYSSAVCTEKVTRSMDCPACALPLARGGYTIQLVPVSIFLSFLFSQFILLTVCVAVKYKVVIWFVHSEQKSIGLKFSKSRTGSDVQYSCHHNSSCFTFPIFAYSWRFSFFHSLQSFTPRIY